MSEQHKPVVAFQQSFFFQFYSKENRQTMGVMEQLSVDSLFGDVQRMDKRQVSVGQDCFPNKPNLNVQ